MGLDKIIQELRRLCEEKHSGTLFITTEENHAVRFVLKNGEIIGIAYRNKHGLAALPLVRSITGGTYTFADNCVFQSYTESSAWSLPGTAEIFRQFGVNLETFAIPKVSRATIPLETVVPPAAAPIPELVGSAFRKSAKKILVVEDSDVTRKLIAKILIQGGYNVVEAEDGLAAFARLNEENPDLMLLDIVMPGIDGYKVLSMVRKHEKFRKLPVIMMTSKVNLLDRLRGKMDGSIEYLAKPFTSDQLLEKLKVFFYQTGRIIYDLAV